MLLSLLTFAFTLSGSFESFVRDRFRFSWEVFLIVQTAAARMTTKLHVIAMVERQHGCSCMILAVLALVQTVVSGSQAYFLHFGVSVLCRCWLYYAMARLRVPLPTSYRRRSMVSPIVRCERVSRWPGNVKGDSLVTNVLLYSFLFFTAVHESTDNFFQGWNNRAEITRNQETKNFSCAYSTMLSRKGVSTTFA